MCGPKVCQEFAENLPRTCQEFAKNLPRHMTPASQLVLHRHPTKSQISQILGGGGDPPPQGAFDGMDALWASQKSPRSILEPPGVDLEGSGTDFWRFPDLI